MAEKSYIGVISPPKELTVSKESQKQNRCTVCDKPGKNIFSYCEQCEKGLCQDCTKVHSKLTESHTIMSVAEYEVSVKEYFNRQLGLLKDESAVLDEMLSNKRENTKKAHDVKAKKLKVVNQIRDDMIRKIDELHKRLTEEVNNAYKVPLADMEQQENALVKASSKLGEMMDLVQATQQQDAVTLTEKKRSVAKKIEEDLKALKLTRAKLDSKVTLPVVKVVKGQDWIPGKPSTIQVIQGNEWTYQIQQVTMAQREQKQIHAKYRKVKSIQVNYYLPALFVNQGQLWVPSGDSIIFAFSTEDLSLKHKSVHNCLKEAESIVISGTSIVVCDRKTGLHHFSENAKYIGCIMPGSFSDACFAQGELYALDYKQQVVNVLTRVEQGWKKKSPLKLSQYTNGANGDKLCANDTSLFLSSWNDNCVLVYSLAGKLLSKHGGINRPKVCDVDKDGNVLVCDCWNNRICVLDHKDGKWREISGFKTSTSAILCASIWANNIWVGSLKKNSFLVDERKITKYEAF